MIKVNSDSSLFVLTAVSASPQFNKRKCMWQHLEDFVATINRPWVLLGDFNDMLSKDEKLEVSLSIPVVLGLLEIA